MNESFIASSFHSRMLRINDLTQQSLNIFAQMEQCANYLDILSRLDATAPVPEAIVKFVKDTQPAMEGLINVSLGTGSLISNTIDGLKRLLNFLWNLAVDLFKWLTDQYYRAQRKFIRYNRIILDITEPSRIAQIEKQHVSVGSFNTVSILLHQVIAMNKEIQSASAVSIADHIDRFVVTATTDFGCRYIDGKVIEGKPFVDMQSTGLMIDLGWSVDNIKDIISGVLTAAAEMVASKVTEKNTLGAIRALENEINSLVRNNTEPVLIESVQKRVADRRKIHNFILSSLSVAAIRYTWVGAQLDKLIEVVERTR